MLWTVVVLVVVVVVVVATVVVTVVVVDVVMVVVGPSLQTYCVCKGATINFGKLICEILHCHSRGAKRCIDLLLTIISGL